MQIAGQILFFAVFLAFLYFLYQRIKIIRNNIGKGRKVNLNNNVKRRWRNVFLIAFGQKKMFRKIVPAIFHLLIYVGFIIINIEILEFIIDGLTGQHRIFAVLLQDNTSLNESYNAFYNILMNLFEFLVLGVIIACIIFLIRRNILKMNRFSGIEMTRWPLLDANLILIFEIILMLAILIMNGADQALQVNQVDKYIDTGTIFFSRLMIFPIFQNQNPDQLIIIERVAWWIHIIGIFGFAVYVTYSKHLHIFMAFPNTYYASLIPVATMDNMEDVMKEVKMMLGLEQIDSNTPPAEIPRFGARDITDLTWKNLMDAYTCTECGRCTSVCPANITGKKLSPRKIIMDVRDRVEVLGDLKGKEDGKSLFDHISKEEIFACTTCNACIDVCPVSIDPVSVIISMRRYIAMEESTSPSAWNIMFNNIETNFAPWKFPASDRFKWAEGMQINNDPK
jgi:heterodisulfide reductase subunit C